MGMGHTVAAHAMESRGSGGYWNKLHHANYPYKTVEKIGRSTQLTLIEVLVYLAEIREPTPGS